MEQNQTSPQTPSPAPSALPVSSEPKVIGHTVRASSNRPIFLLIVLLIVILVFSAIIVRNYQGQQEQTQGIQNSPRSIVSPTPVVKSTVPQTQEERDLQNIDVNNDNADLQGIKSDLQAL